MTSTLDLETLFFEVLKTQNYPITSKVHFVKILANYNKKLTYVLNM